MPDYYKYFPADRLSVIYYGKRDLEKALYYNTLTLECYPQDDRVIRNRETMLKEMAALDVLLPKDTVKELENFITSKGFDFQLVHNFASSADIKILKSEVIPLEICWLIPYVDVNNPSTRIRRINVNKKLNVLGTKSVIIDNYYPTPIDKTLERVGNSNVTVFTQFSEYDLELMKRLRVLGKRIVLDFNEAILGSPFVSDCMNASDIIVCCSKKLEELTIEHGHANTAIIKDAVEDVTVPAMNYASREKPVAVWCGMGGNSFLATEVLKEAIQSAGYSLLVLSEWDYPSGSWFDHKKWGIDTWVKDMMDCDVVLCPQREEVQPGKSNVKVTQAMALGIPVIASKMLSYTEVIEHGKNGYLASIKSPKEWNDALIELKDVSKRHLVGTNGLNSISKYRLESVANEWINLSKGLLKSSQKEKVLVPKTKPLKMVDLIISSYNNVEYLKLLISSIKLNTTHPHNIIISDAGSNEETWEYLNTLKGFTILGAPGVRLNFSEANNAGVRKSTTEYFVLLNNDLILGRGCLEAMVNKMDTVDRLAACGCLSNCNSGWTINAPGRSQFNMTLEKSGLTLRPGMKIEEIAPHLSDLYSFMEKSNVANKGKFERRDWVAYFCVMFARSAWDECGFLDPSYFNGGEDLDHSLRLSMGGFLMGEAMDAFVFHFGAISRSYHEKELNSIGPRI